METIKLYQDWPKDLNFWQEKLRHLYWVSLFRVNLLSSLTSIAKKRCLDLGSGPQFTSHLLEKKGAKVITLDKFAPAHYEVDINLDLSKTLDKEPPFDIILMGAVIRYVTKPEQFFTQIASLLKKDGLLFIDEYVHSPANDFYLNYMNQMGAMEQWPKENFPTLESIKEALKHAPQLKIDKAFSCWPGFYLEGEHPFCLWYSLAIKKGF